MIRIRANPGKVYAIAVDLRTQAGRGKRPSIVGAGRLGSIPLEVVDRNTSANYKGSISEIGGIIFVEVGKVWSTEGGARTEDVWREGATIISVDGVSSIESLTIAGVDHEVQESIVIEVKGDDIKYVFIGTG